MRAEDHRRDLTRDSDAGLIHSSVPERSGYISAYVKHVPRKYLNQFPHYASPLLPGWDGRGRGSGPVIVIDNSAEERLEREKRNESHVYPFLDQLVKLRLITIDLIIR